MKTQGGNRTPYTPEQVAFIQAHYNVDMSARQIADHFGRGNENAIRKTAYNLRARGLEITERTKHMGDLSHRCLPIGTKRIREMEDGRKELHVKTERGWRYLGRSLDSENMPVKRRKKSAVRKETDKRVVYRTDVNPSEVKVKKDEGGKYVWDAEKILWRLKKQLAA